MKKDVRLSPFFQMHGITENHRGYPGDQTLKIFGADTETVDGQPWTLQIDDGKGPKIWRVTKETIFKTLIDGVLPGLRDGGINLVFFHNLNFDLRVIFADSLREIYDQYNEIHLKKHGWKVKMMFGKVNAAEIQKGRYKFKLIDSMAFCPPGARSLVAALKIYGVDEEKLPKPEGLGTEALWNDEFIKYALNDAKTERLLGLSILAMHKAYDLSPCVSLPMFAGRVLRHHFFEKGETFPVPATECRKAAELAYHAGKNGFYVKRGIYENVYEYDINSAFPHAMRSLPQFVRGKYRLTREYEPGKAGVYEIRGYAGPTKYPCLWDHEFKRLSGHFEPTWVTGFEIELAREDLNYKFEILQGWIWDEDERHSHSPLQEFVDKFWMLKNTTPKGPKRDTFKNILNSLYGKFAGCVEKREVYIDKDGVSWPLTEDKHYEAGSLYHPFIAAQITGHVRAILTRLEREGSALHSATDSIKTLKKLPSSDTLGGLKEEAYGRCYLFRTKLYLHFAVDNSRCGHDLTKVKIFDENQHLCKYALHGFKGTVAELFKHRFQIMKDGEFQYTYQHMTGLREGMRRKEVINRMNTRSELLKLGA